MNNTDEQITTPSYSKYTLPLTSLVLLILLLSFLPNIIRKDYAVSIIAAFMLIVPIMLGRDENLFDFKLHGFLKGVAATVVVLVIYIAALYVVALLTGKSLSFRQYGYMLYLVQLLMVAIPEEVFFRGYLQKEFGNDIRAIVIVSVLFAISHFIAICLATGAGMNMCVQNILTFFPSLVMGYLYYRTGTIWSSVFFHFTSNIVHIQIIMN